MQRKSNKKFDLKIVLYTYKMSLSTIDKSHLDELMLSLYENDNALEAIKASHSDYAQLKLIAKQINMLKNEAKLVLDRSIIRSELEKIKKTFKLVSGNTYYIYEKHCESGYNNKYFSIISPEEWLNGNIEFKDIFIGKYYYDYDKQFVLLDR